MCLLWLLYVESVLDIDFLFIPKNWNEIEFKFQEANRIIWLKVHHGGVKPNLLLKWQSAVAFVR